MVFKATRNWNIGPVVWALAYSLFFFGFSGFASSERLSTEEILQLPDGPLEQEGPFGGSGSYPVWKYDPGPDPSDPMQRELIDLFAEIPSFSGLSEQIYGDEMFRPAFGPIPWRMMLEPNSVKILFIGQDGTHIAEAANRPATAGFGGRAQDLAQYFGVSSSAAFINTYAFTIRWQYSHFDAPYVYDERYFGTTSFTSNPVWLITQNQDSPLVKWRNKLIDWIIKNNKDSLKLIVAFGGAARDALAAYVESKGENVGPRRDEDLTKVKIPEFGLEWAVANSQAAFPYTEDGDDLYRIFSPNFSAGDYRDEALVESLHEEFKAAFDNDWYSRMVFSHGGLEGSGMIHPAQYGGYDIERKMQIQGEETISLKGLKIDDSLTIGHDILVSQFPHPTALSLMSWQDASDAVASDIENFSIYRDAGWEIEPDPGFENSYAKGLSYRYARADIGTEYYDFGAPDSRMVNISTARRMGRNTIILGTRDNVSFDEDILDAMHEAMPSLLPSDEDMWISRPRSKENRYIFDEGPGEKYAKLMKASLPTDDEFLSRHETNGDFSHYRGTFKNPKVLIVADPAGDDDLITGRALTGARGQHIHDLMQDIGVGDDYLLIKTAPYSKNQCSGNDWEETFEKTKHYRDIVLNEIMKDFGSQISFILADGPWAAQASHRIVGKYGKPIIEISRSLADDRLTNEGLKEALQQIKQVSGYESVQSDLGIRDISRSHLPYYSRLWEGTSGNRVLMSDEKEYCGIAYAVVVPYWASNQDFYMSSDEWDAVQYLKAKYDDLGLRRGGESVQSFVKRMGL